MKWQNSVVIASLVLNILMAAFVITTRANADISQVYVPPLSKDTGYQVVIPHISPSCIDIEAQLGLNRGDVVMITRDEIKGTIITFRKGVLIDAVQVQTATNMIKGIMPKVEVK